MIVDTFFWLAIEAHEECLDRVGGDGASWNVRLVLFDLEVKDPVRCSCDGIALERGLRIEEYGDDPRLNMLELA